MKVLTVSTNVAKGALYLVRELNHSISNASDKISGHLQCLYLPDMNEPKTSKRCMTKWLYSYKKSKHFDEHVKQFGDDDDDHHANTHDDDDDYELDHHDEDDQGHTHIDLDDDQ